jgi:hypothetical protein
LAKCTELLTGSSSAWQHAADAIGCILHTSIICITIVNNASAWMQHRNGITSHMQAYLVDAGLLLFVLVAVLVLAAGRLFGF